MVRLLEIMGLACAIRAGEFLIKPDSSYAGTLPQFDYAVWSSQITLHFWAKPYVTPSSSQSVFASFQAL
jgi:hypothetical protein